MDEREALGIAHAVLTREGVSLDERRWDDWLALYAADCEYWVPTWTHADRLAEDPRREVSHIYYANRAGLEDRIARIRTGRSPASTPLKRTLHAFGNLVVLEAAADRIACRASWSCHAYDPHTLRTELFFGHAHYALGRADAGWIIRRKKTVLLNDTLPAAVDVYCL